MLRGALSCAEVGIFNGMGVINKGTARSGVVYNDMVNALAAG